MVYMPSKEIKILAVNPKIIVNKDFIDYPYYLNINLYLNLSYLLDNINNLNISIFDSFSVIENSFIKQKDSFTFWWDFEYEKHDKNYDYILINFSPFLTYKKENIDNINKILSNYIWSKIIYLNSYSWGFCYIDYKDEYLKNKWFNFDILLNWNTEDKLVKLLWWKVESIKSINIYSDFYLKIDFNNYLNFLKKISISWLLDFYSIDENSIPIYTSKWCIFNCVFCTSSNKNVKGYSIYSIHLLEKELIFLKDKLWIKKLIILDALFNKDLENTNKLLDLFIKYWFDIEIPNWVRLDLLNENLISKLSKILKTLSISIESWNQMVNDNIIKKWLKLSRVFDVCKLANKYSLKLVSHYIIWFPDETISNINNTLEFAYRLYIDYWVFPLIQFATPLPWTELWDKSNIDLYSINLFEKFQTDYILESSNFTYKDLLNIKDYFYKKIEVSKTKKIIINLTYACQNNCIFCATWDRYKLSQEFSYVVAQLINYYKKWVRLLDLDWWEPTLYKDLFRVIKVAKKIWYSFVNLTSSWRKYRDSNFLEELLLTWVDSLLVSLHWTNDYIHDEITRKKWSFEETILGIDNILKLRKKYNFNFGINITLCKINEDNFSDYLLFIEKFNPDVVNVQFLTPFWNAENLWIIEQDIVKCCDVLKEKIWVLTYKLNIINLPFCYMEWFESYVTWDISKMERDMLFVWQKPSNLYNYLAVARERRDKCNDCNYKIVCDWFYKF